ncbi:MAG: STAS domain-containing protein [Methanobacteriaceae archaeon]|nr:STAS domain-containing protein [Methanobacteriaceae archaeon]
MMEDLDVQLVSTTIVNKCLVVPIQVELFDDTIIQLQSEILDKIQKEDLRGVIIDLSAINVVDSFLAGKLREIGYQTVLMGVDTILTSLKPEVAASIADMEYDLGNVIMARDQDHAFQIIDSNSKKII